MSEFAEYAPDGAPGLPFGEADGLVVRLATEADLARLAPISAEREGHPVEQVLEGLRKFFETVSTGRGLLMIAEAGADAIGFGKASHFVAPPGSPPNVAPDGWYLSGVVVSPRHRRRGVGAHLTAARLAGIDRRAPGSAVYYFANERNRVSVDLHRAFGFGERSRDFSHPHAHFEGGAGILFVRRGPEAPESLE
jgi:ribosomal protein S18 acetylase RimI-like enzyme